jgi:flagellar basal body-associated protein FliL
MSEASPGKESRKLLWIVVGIVLFFFVCAGIPLVVLGVLGFTLYHQSADQLEKLGGPVSVEELPPIEVTVSELVSAYREDTNIANNRYKGKLVQVTGTVGKIEEPWVQLGSEKGTGGGGVGLLQVRIQFSNQDKNKMATLTKGKRITVQGKCTGKGAGDTIEVENCFLVK